MNRSPPYMANGLSCRPNHPWQFFWNQLRGFESVWGRSLPFFYLQVVAVQPMIAYNMHLMMCQCALTCHNYSAFQPLTQIPTTVDRYTTAIGWLVCWPLNGGLLTFDITKRTRGQCTVLSVTNYSSPPSNGQCIIYDCCNVDCIDICYAWESREPSHTETGVWWWMARRWTGNCTEENGQVCHFVSHPYRNCHSEQIRW